MSVHGYRSQMEDWPAYQPTTPSGYRRVVSLEGGSDINANQVQAHQVRW